MKRLTVEILREDLHYDPATGIFTRRHTRGRYKAGEIAGTLTQEGYWQINVRRTCYPAHRLAWMYVYGDSQLPPVVDHVNGNVLDNRIKNLRAATIAENSRNSKVRSRNVIGLKGVSQVGGMFRARISVDRKSFDLGLFETAEEAHAAYISAALKHHGGFARSA